MAKIKLKQIGSTIRRPESQKKVLIVVSDGGDNASKAKFEEVLATALERGTLRCRVVMTDERGGPRCAHVRAPAAIWSA